MSLQRENDKWFTTISSDAGKVRFYKEGLVKTVKFWPADISNEELERLIPFSINGWQRLRSGDTNEGLLLKNGTTDVTYLSSGLR